MECYQKVLRPKTINTQPKYAFVTLYTAGHWVTFGSLFLEKIPTINFTNIYLGLMPFDYSTNSLSSKSPISARHSLYHTAFTPVLHYKYSTNSVSSKSPISARHSLGTPSRSLAHSSWDTLYIYIYIYIHKYTQTHTCVYILFIYIYINI